LVISQTPYDQNQQNKEAKIPPYIKQDLGTTQNGICVYTVKSFYCGSAYIPMKTNEAIASMGPVVDTKRCLANPATFCTLALIPEDKLVEWLQKKTAQGITEGEVELKQIDWMNTDEYRTAKGRTFNDLLKGK
jgi:hypothetical protein